MTIEAGADIVLMPTDYISAYNELCAAVRSGRITEARIDESVLRILELKDKYGLLGDGPVKEDR
jgi:beta-N-acetylhexosaminidase